MLPCPQIEKMKLKKSYNALWPVLEMPNFALHQFDDYEEVYSYQHLSQKVLKGFQSVLFCLGYCLILLDMVRE